MVRSLLCVAVLCLPCSVAAQAPPPADDSAFNNQVIVQTTIMHAKMCLTEGKTQKAIQVLEANLPRINGNAAYLQCLRDAYRQYIKDLALAQRNDLAEKYIQRLSILDKDAPNDPVLKSLQNGKTATQTAADASPSQGGNKFYQRVVPEEPKETTPLARLTQATADPTTVRGKLTEDPFDLANQRAPAPNPGAMRGEQARTLLAQAEDEFRKRHFEQARILFGRAFEIDRGVTAESRDRWAYCTLNHVVEQLNGGKVDGDSLIKLTDDVRSAVAMSPAMANTGRWLIEELDQRKAGSARVAAPAAATAVPVQHSQRGGWQIAETAHFRIYHNQGREFAERIATMAERTHADVLRKWFGGNGVQWRARCDVYMHATAQAYASATGVSATSPGHSRIETDSGNVVSRRMDLRCDVANLLTGVLPHETTHVVLAGQFGKHDVPRWADEGMAVLSEPADSVAQHRRNLSQCLQNRQVFTIRELMHLRDYPHSQRVTAFYAQSVDLVAFFSELRGPLVFAEFLREGLQSGYEDALRRHYGLSGFDDLQARWNAQANNVAARK